MTWTYDFPSLTLNLCLGTHEVTCAFKHRTRPAAQILTRNRASWILLGSHSGFLAIVTGATPALLSADFICCSEGGSLLLRKNTGRNKMQPRGVVALTHTCSFLPISRCPTRLLTMSVSTPAFLDHQSRPWKKHIPALGRRWNESLVEEAIKAHRDQHEDRDRKRGNETCQLFLPDSVNGKADSPLLAHSFCTQTCQHRTPSRRGEATRLFWNPAGLPCKRLSYRCPCRREKSVKCMNYRK
ncbi:uncharacterized protein LOC122215238 [Panthera leo]|uniref:uncharacterized protein LOC122215238 n=1 Tax=Panthera leo TaxID=9689 RepID=UPI001C69CEC7|nr:uncharacterized protein LOC122215238 [Panthera leo]